VIVWGGPLERWFRKPNDGAADQDSKAENHEDSGP
jgi:hypothetical protein